MKKSLLIVVDEKRMGGVSILLEDMINLNVFKDYDTDILVLHNNGEMFEDIKDKVNIIYGTKYFDAVDLTIKEVLKSKNISLIFKKIRLVFEMKTGLIKNRIKKERKKILNKTYDIEIAFKDGFTAIFTAFGNSIQKIHWLHYEYGASNPNQKYQKLFKDDVFPKFDKFVAVSNGVKESFQKDYSFSKIEIIPNIIDSEKIINLSKEESKVVPQKDKINIYLLGRLHYVKGYERFLNVLKKLKKDNLLDKINVNIIGDGPLKNVLNEINIENKLNVNFCGQMKNPYKEIKNADLLVLPSLYEAFGLVVLESFILKVPVLSTMTAATSSIIDNNRTGIIVENSENGIYEGLKKLVENPSEIKILKENLNDFNYSIENQISEIKRVLEE